MNILPKKRWHVRTRENIARVRKDEAAAAEEEKKKHQKILLAEKEARTELLRSQARSRYPKSEATQAEEGNPQQEKEISLIGSNGHVNLFYELEQTNIVSDQKNADHEREEKAEREKEEMKIGYLTYLGQDTCELTGQVSWYNLPPRRTQSVSSTTCPTNTTPSVPDSPSSTTVNVNSVPLPEYRSVLPRIKKESKKSKKRKKEKKILKLAKKILEKKERRKKRRRRKSSSESDGEKMDKSLRKNREPVRDIDKLRQERLKREQVERARAAAYLARLRGDPVTSPEPAETEQPNRVIPKYNSQFNPELAKQNY